MLDKYGRNIDYLRLSITDRCNLSCVYCAPAERNNAENSSSDMPLDDIIRICKLFSAVGINHFKITGGEPLMRNDVAHLVKEIKSFNTKPTVSITTNGILLGNYLDDLYDAGIDAINISLDSLSKEKYYKVSGHDSLDIVIKNINKATEYQSFRVKINTVILDNYNEIVSLANLAKNNKIDVRFIEMMPIGAGKNFQFIGEQQIKDTLESNFGIPTKILNKIGNGPSKYFQYPNFTGLIGFISAISHEFCSQCNKIRLTSDGYLKECLQFASTLNLHNMLNKKYSDEDIINVIKKSIYNKPEKHLFNSNFDYEEKNIELEQMKKIGG
ncbi:GTP 3',8-cyclase MoaA [Fusobacterium sp. PH5-44]|uniref:GTP 3',8-cyclase MoaA n=1 Tax=unclassified Fusobacterium TaxID=2648384 RepID=UPI003D1FA340